MYLDRVKIMIKSGNGGDGIASFHRDKNTINGGPDGGDGGKGGDLIFRATNSLSTLQTFQFKKKFMAENGMPGRKQKKYGLSGKDLIIEVPVGTVIIDAETGKVVQDMVEDGYTWVALKGGQGGRGNVHFANSVRQSPRFSETGRITDLKEVVLELKTLADVGVIGFPNVGKSTLLSVVSNAKPKIANYQFTTLFPNLGVVNHYENTFIMADIPGLIEGASEGQGLGHYFLRHIERVRMLVHVIDIAQTDGRDMIEDYFVINQELEKYSPELSKKKQIVVLNKIDMLTEEDLADKVKKFKEKTGQEVILISAITQKNLEELKNKIWEVLKTIPKPEPIEIELLDFDAIDKTSLEIQKLDQNEYIVSGGYIDNLIRGVVLSDFVSFSYFQRRLLDDGVIEKLKENGMQPGDTVHIKDISFVYEI